MDIGNEKDGDRLTDQFSTEKLSKITDYFKLEENDLDDLHSSDSTECKTSEYEGRESKQCDVVPQKDKDTQAKGDRQYPTIDTTELHERNTGNACPIKPPAYEDIYQNSDPYVNETTVKIDEIEETDPRTDLKKTKKSSKSRTVVCRICSKSMLSSSLQRHLQEKHKSDRTNLSVTCADPHDAVYLVSKTGNGLQYPIYVQNRNFGANMTIKCEEELCMIAKTMSYETGNVAWVCDHIKATQHYTDNSFKEVTLFETSLDELVMRKVISDMKRDTCKELNNTSGKHPLIVEHFLKDGSSIRYKYLSVFSDKVSYYSPFGRVTVTFDSENCSLSSRCCKQRSNCVHRCVALWYVYQQYGIVIETNREQDTKTQDHAEEPIIDNKGRLIYPPVGAALKEMVHYIHNTKRTYPYSNTANAQNNYATTLYPAEIYCHKCEQRLDTHLVRDNGKILTTTGVITGK